MDITIYDLLVDDVDKVLTQDTENYGRIIRQESTLDNTVDILFNVKGICVTENAINITFPNNNILFTSIPSDNYHKIEVM